MKTVKLKDHPTSNCKVEIDDTKNTIVFISYKTRILKAYPIYDDKENIIRYDLLALPEGKYWDRDMIYTATTARQISYFLKEYFPKVSYSEFKKSALNKETVYIACQLKDSKKFWFE